MNAKSRPKKRSRVSKKIPKALNEEIALRAYLIWEEEGRPEGREVVHWLQAEAEILRTGKPDTDRI